jgi:hypothetical protein
VKRQYSLGIGILVILFTVSLTGVLAADNPGEPYVLQRINGKVKLDGLSDETAWQGIKPLPLVMQTPNFGKTPSEKTEIFVAYDEDYLYLAGRMYDSQPDKARGTSKKRDDLGPGNDWFGVVLDTFNDKENALAFFTTPTGLRLDMTVFNDAEGELPINISWNTFWDVKTVRNDKGWFAEIRIPFSSLRFQDKNGEVVMGLTSWRWISRKNETAIFPAIPPDAGQWSVFKPSRAQEVLLSGVHSRNALYVAPYILGGFTRTFDLNDSETAYAHTDDPAYEAGVDIKYSLSSNLTMDITVNTDFAQVEADDEVVNLTRFSLFFPEKRLFFQERSGIFDFTLGGGNRLFYSRRIGLYEGQPIRIYGGVRLVGRLGAWDLGLMSMQTAAADVEIEDEDEPEHLPSYNFSVLRVRRRVINPYSYIGALVTSKIGMDGTYNIAYGLDGIFRLFGDNYLTVNWAQTFENDADNKFFSLDPSRLRINWARRNLKGLVYDLSFSRSGETYNPEMGFQERDDYTRFGTRVGWGWLPGEKSSILAHQVSLDGFLFLANRDRSVESAELGAAYEFSLKKGYFGKISFKGFHEFVDEGFSFDEEEDETDPDVPIGEYSFYGVEAIFVTPMIRRILVQANVYAGSFYDGQRISIGLSPTWSVSSGLELNGTYQFEGIRFNSRDKRLNIHIARVRALAMLNTKLSVSAFIQYNSIIDAVTANIRLRYNPREGNDLYLVYNEGLNTNRYREVPTLPTTDNRTIMLKYTYTFQF